MGNNQNKRISFYCDNCGTLSNDKPSSYKRKKRHFCSMKCYAEFQRDKLPIEEHNQVNVIYENPELLT
jgi:hypothetical protein